MVRLGVHLKSYLHCSQYPILYKKVQESNREKWDSLPSNIIFILTHKREVILHWTVLIYIPPKIYLQHAFVSLF